jgi:hypothetical protein
MKHYKDPNTNEIYAYEADGSQDAFIKEGLVAITDAEAEAVRAAAQEAFFNALSYAEKRAAEYPPMTDYLDGVVKGDQAQIDKYIADCLAVKTKYPKATP